MRSIKSSKIYPVTPPNSVNSLRSCRSSVNTKTSWLDISECNKQKEEASNLLNTLLNDVDTITSGVVCEKSSSSCSVIPLYLPAAEAQDETHEDHRLVNWKRWLEIREKDSKKMARSTLRHQKELLINTNPNDYRKILSRKGIFEKSVFDAGNLNFWKMPVKSRQGLYVSTPKSQKSCNRPEIVYTQTPDAILNEQKLKKSEDKSTMMVLKLIDDRKKTRLIKTESFESYQPRMEKLALTGRELQVEDSDISCDKHQNVPIPLINFPPVKLLQQVLMVNEIRAENRQDFIKFVNISIDLTFDSFKYNRTARSLKLENRGEIAIDLSFEKLEVSATTASFFFDKVPFRIIPKEVLEITFNFYPIQTGFFCEKWKLKCEPPFAHEHQIKINLIGSCKRKHFCEDEVAKLENEISCRAAQFTVQHEIRNIIDLSVPMCKEDRSSTNVNQIEVKFKEINPNLTYHPSIVDLMSQLHHQLNGSEWNYDVDALYRHIMNIHDDDEMQKRYYRQFNDAFTKLLTQKKKRDHLDDGGKIVKTAMIKSLFGQFFERFEIEMETSDDPVNSVAKNLAITINKMISIWES